MAKPQISDQIFGKTLLIVDDNAAFCESLRKLVRKEYKSRDREDLPRILDCDNCTAAKQILKQTRCDVVVVDMRMRQRPLAEIDFSAGIDLTKHIKSVFRERIRVIVATAFGAISDSTKAMRIGCFDYVEKIESRELVRSILWALDLSGDRDELVERLILADWDILESDGSAYEQGMSLESLCSSIFSTIPGWYVQERVRTHIDEIDLKVRNESPDEFWKNFGPFILVECKNWRKRKPGRDALDSLLGKIARNCLGSPKLGFFVSVNGTPGTFGEALVHARSNDILVALIDRDALRLLIRGEASGESLGVRRGQLLKDLVAGS